MKETAEIKFRPTFWRTCRAVMNETRLRLLKAVVESQGKACVVKLAKAVGIDESLASICLRQLNARGLLGVRRERIKVLYNTEQDRSVPDAVVFQEALVKYLQQDLPDKWELDLIRRLKAFTHFNRLAIIIRLAEGPATIAELYDSVGVVVKSLYHHLKYLTGAKLIEVERRYGEGSVIRLIPQNHPVVQAMLRIVLAGAKDGQRYYNPGSGATDAATRRGPEEGRYSRGKSKGKLDASQALYAEEGCYPVAQPPSLAGGNLRISKVL